MAVKVYIVFYSMYGHVHKMAQAIKEGVDAVEGVESVLYQVEETLPQEVLDKMHAPPKPDVPVISRDDITKADAFIFGFPTRFGMMPAQFKAFFDGTGQLWQQGALVGKPATFFTSTATPAGGADITIFTSITQLAAHGMIYVPFGYQLPVMFDTSIVKGGSPYGAATIAGPTGERSPVEAELDIAKAQGKYFAGVAKKLAV